MRDLDIGIIIVSYRSADLTVDCLRSLELEQSTPGLNIRTVVVDNDSGDFAPIAEFVRRNRWTEWISVVAAPRNGGFAYGNNLGIQSLVSNRPPDYIYLLNPDTKIRRGAIRTLVSFLETHPDVGIAGSSFETADGVEWPIAFRFPSLVTEICEGISWGIITRALGNRPCARQMKMDRPEPVDWICGASMMIRPAVFDAIGGMDENYFLYYEETDFCHRARLAGYPTWYVPESRVMHIGGQSTKVTEQTPVPKPFPPYWFESRRRYFAVTYGIRHAAIIDVTAILSLCIGSMKRFVLGRRNESIPRFLRGLIRHSVLWPGNRDVAAVRSGVTPGWFRAPRTP